MNACASVSVSLDVRWAGPERSCRSCYEYEAEGPGEETRAEQPPPPTMLGIIHVNNKKECPRNMPSIRRRPSSRNTIINITHTHTSTHVCYTYTHVELSLPTLYLGEHPPDQCHTHLHHCPNHSLRQVSYELVLLQLGMTRWPVVRTTCDPWITSTHAVLTMNAYSRLVGVARLCQYVYLLTHTT